MIPDISVFKTGTFTDFEGKERKFIVCALSQSPEEYDFTSMEIGWHNDDDSFEKTVSVKRIVSIGVSLCNPIDEFDEELGKTIAENKAKEDEHCLSQIYTPNNGVINATLVEALLTDQVNFIAKHPEKVFKGYYTAKVRYEENKRRQELFESLDDNHRTVYHMLKEKLVNLDVIKNLLKWK